MTSSDQTINHEFLWLAYELRQCPYEADGYLPMDDDEIEEQVFPLLMQLDNKPIFINIHDVLRRSFVLIVRDKDSQNIVGMAVLSEQPPSFLSQKVGMIREFVIDEGCLDCGIEARMFEVLEMAARALHLTELAVEIHSANNIDVVDACAGRGFRFVRPSHFCLNLRS
jgi:N-acetylglutamate synthase-like GNAT family acetyltransferase